MSITRWLFKAARLSADARAVSRALEAGSPAPVAWRIKNKAVGRAIGSLTGRAGVWR